MTAPTFDLGTLHGGLRLPILKDESTARVIQHVPVPAQLVLPLAQHAGEPAHPIVGIGERVLKGQLIADADGIISAPVHASSSGKVVAIEQWPVSRRFGENAPCIVIECDGVDQAVHLSEEILPFEKQGPETLFQKILYGGIVGLGGAVFPTAQKLMEATTESLEHLIINGVECESYISCDDMLMRERAIAVIVGAQILLHALGLDHCFIAVESDKPEAIHALADAAPARARQGKGGCRRRRAVAGRSSGTPRSARRPSAGSGRAGPWEQRSPATGTRGARVPGPRGPRGAGAAREAIGLRRAAASTPGALQGGASAPGSPAVQAGYQPLGSGAPGRGSLRARGARLCPPSRACLR